MKKLRGERGEPFFLQALTCAQSLWLQGLPAQSILLLNRAFGAELQQSDAVLESWPLPYAAMHWILSNRTEDMFIGNPRRHFQHLATRMVEPQRERRTWRAWACWAYAREVFPNEPADEKQIEEEGIKEPSLLDIEERLAELGLNGEAQLWRDVLTHPSQEPSRGSHCIP